YPSLQCQCRTQSSPTCIPLSGIVLYPQRLIVHNILQLADDKVKGLLECTPFHLQFVFAHGVPIQRLGNDGKATNMLEKFTVKESPEEPCLIYSCLKILL